MSTPPSLPPPGASGSSSQPPGAGGPPPGVPGPPPGVPGPSGLAGPPSAPPLGEPPARRRRGLVAALVAVGLAVVLVGGGVVAVLLDLGGDDPYSLAAWDEARAAAATSTSDELDGAPAVPATATDGAASPAADVPRLQHHPCPFTDEYGAEGVTCATLTVSADRHDPANTAVVDLAVAIVPATVDDPADDPILYLEGGPGGPAVAWFDQWVESPWSRLRRDRDVVLLDQRGTGYSTPTLSCDAAWDAPRSELPAVLLGCRDDAVADGAVLSGVSTREHAADVADLRVALGIEQWNLVGVSYGTRTALAVLRDHPEGVRSVVLDSVYPPGVDVVAEQGEIAVAAFDALARACVDDAGCRLEHGDPWETLSTAAAALDAEPVEVHGEPRDGADLVGDVVAALYDTDLASRLPAILADATDDPGQAFELLDGEVGPGPWFGPRRAVAAYQDSEGTFYAVECREEVAGADLAEARARTAALPVPFATGLGRQLEDLLTVCADYGSGVATPQERAPATSDVPALLLTGGLDPVTPAAWAERAAGTLPNATVVAFPAVGHGVVLSGSCAVGLVTAFLAEPDAPAEASCAAAFDVPRFTG